MSLTNSPGSAPQTLDPPFSSRPTDSTQVVWCTLQILLPSAALRLEPKRIPSLFLTHGSMTPSNFIFPLISMISILRCTFGLPTCPCFIFSPSAILVQHYRLQSVSSQPVFSLFCCTDDFLSWSALLQPLWRTIADARQPYETINNLPRKKYFAILLIYSDILLSLLCLLHIHLEGLCPTSLHKLPRTYSWHPPTDPRQLWSLTATGPDWLPPIDPHRKAAGPTLAPSN